MVVSDCKNELNIKGEFKNEKEYQEYIENNIELFCENVIEMGTYISHYSNKSITKNGFGVTKEKVDLIVKGTKGVALIELKCPHNDFCELRNAIGQSLNYIVTAQMSGFEFKKMCIVSPIYDQRIFEIIKRFNLPLELYFLSKHKYGKIEIV